MESLLHNPVALYVTFYVASSAVQAMPEPNTGSSPWYIWLHNFAQILLANWSKMKMPNTMQNSIEEVVKKRTDLIQSAVKEVVKEKAAQAGE